jgi:coproporphyrinogen III oxidase
MNKQIIEEAFRAIQSDINNQLEAADGTGTFQKEPWTREDGGGGLTTILMGGSVIEKGGVNFSAVYGPTPDNILKALKLEKADFYATGVSIVMHPKNPFVPIIHMNIRYFEMSNGVYWFGGGIDLSPHYIFREDAQHFHTSLKAVCDKHDSNYYAEYKKWADDYFFIPHRNETRGIGGIFFDRLSENETRTKEQIFSFVKDVGNLFAPLYISLINRHRDKKFGEKEKQWQCLRRGRYVEFNLVYDKGTKFGLDTNGRTESILMSMPPVANWIYDHHPTEGSTEAITQSLLKKNINWI